MSKRVKVDLSEWYAGDGWVKATKVDVTMEYGNIIITLKDPREEVIKRILAEALEAFFNESMDTLIRVTKEGIKVTGPELSRAVLIPWNKTIIHYDALAKIKAECHEQADQGSEEGLEKDTK